MKLILAKTAGFCFGVGRAVNGVYSLIDKETPNLHIMGELIHNPDVNERIKKAGAKVIEDPSNAKKGDTVVIRTHGVPKPCINVLREKGAQIVDMTCPYVSKIHRLAKKSSDEGYTILIFGHENHPEVEGIKSRCKKFHVFKSVDELKRLSGDKIIDNASPVHILSQTTMDANEWQICIDYAKNIYTNLRISDTICNATDERQKEAASLAETCDAMVVIGGKNSSNTARLFEVASSRCPKTFLVENAGQLDTSLLPADGTVGVTAGASTPDDIIKAVCKKILEVNC